MGKHGRTQSVGVLGAVGRGIMEHFQHKKKNHKSSRHAHASGTSSRTATRFGRSHTRTKTKRKKFGDFSSHNDLSKDFMAIYLSKRKLGKVSSQSTINHQWSSIFTASSGIQGVHYINTFLPVQWFTTGLSTGAPTTANQLACSPFDLNPYQVTTGSIANAVNAYPLNDKAGIKSIKGEYQFTNFSTADAEVDVYWVKYNMDSNASGTPTAIWSAMCTNANVGGVNATQATKTTNPVSGAMLATTMGNSPWVYREFRSQFKLLKCRKFALQAGGTKKIAFNIHVNRYFDDYTQSNMNATGVAHHKGQSIACFMIVRGAVVKDVSSGITYTNQITTAPTDIGVTLAYNVGCVYPAPNKRTYATRTDAGLVADPYVAGGFKLTNVVDAAVTLLQGDI
ncbi:Cap [Trichosanthes kirilowii geminiviridae]|nr:Cap [Trichosanthes kirilowii geminiviridae]